VFWKKKDIEWPDLVEVRRRDANERTSARFTGVLFMAVGVFFLLMGLTPELELWEAAVVLAMAAGAIVFGYLSFSLGQAGARIGGCGNDQRVGCPV